MLFFAYRKLAQTSTAPAAECSNLIQRANVSATLTRTEGSRFCSVRRDGEISIRFLRPLYVSGACSDFTLPAPLVVAFVILVVIE